MRATSDATDEVPGASGPFVSEADVVGQYPPEIAAAASRASMTDQGSGQWRQDD